MSNRRHPITDYAEAMLALIESYVDRVFELDEVTVQESRGAQITWLKSARAISNPLRARNFIGFWADVKDGDPIQPGVQSSDA